jgi:hypothetical protein
MKKLLITAVVTGIFLSSAWAGGGPANKVTGDFVRVHNATDNYTTYECEFTAHAERTIVTPKATKIFGSKGTIICVLTADIAGNPVTDNFWQIELDDGFACVEVFDGGSARIGGQVSTAENVTLGVFVGIDVVDGGEPGIYDGFTMNNFGDDDAGYGDWCANGTPGRVDVYDIVEGNIQVHYYGD